MGNLVNLQDGRTNVNATSEKPLINGNHGAVTSTRSPPRSTDQTVPGQIEPQIIMIISCRLLIVSQAGQSTLEKS